MLIQPLASKFHSSCILGWAMAIGLVAGCDDGAGTSDASSDASSDATSDARDATGDSDTRTDADTTVTGPSAPTLSAVSAHEAGAKGLDLALELVAGDADRDAALARVRVFDASNAPVLAFNTGLGGTPDSNEQLVGFTTAVSGQASFIGKVRMRGLLGTYPLIARVEVAVRDAGGRFSPDVGAEVVAQELRQLGDACDPEVIDDRCSAGLGCRGTPSQCQEGLPPEVSRVAYLKGTDGARILIEGTDPEEDVRSVRIEFLDNAGAPLTVDLDNDEVPESTDFVVSAADLAQDGKFFLRVTPVPGFEALVPQVAVTATDDAGHTGARKTAKLAVTPVRGLGQACDANGFDTCNATSVCAPGVPGLTNTCKAKAQLGAAECAAAPVFAPGDAPVIGIADGPSLWDAPSTCSAGDPVGRPEAVAVLRLASAVASLTLTTALPGTNFDTVLYLLPGCGAAAAVPLGCADDSPDGSGAATLTLTNVPAGDYLVVVDAWGPEGGSFALAASTP